MRRTRRRSAPARRTDDELRRWRGGDGNVQRQCPHAGHFAKPQLGCTARSPRGGAGRVARRRGRSVGPSSRAGSITTPLLRCAWCPESYGSGAGPSEGRQLPPPPPHLPWTRPKVSHGRGGCGTSMALRAPALSNALNAPQTLCSEHCKVKPSALSPVPLQPLACGPSFI